LSFMSFCNCVEGTNSFFSQLQPTITLEDFISNVCE
jgi:hypothetical protein